LASLAPSCRSVRPARVFGASTATAPITAAPEISARHMVFRMIALPLGLDPHGCMDLSIEGRTFGLAQPESKDLCPSLFR
jgi:hypothetical protein